MTQAARADSANEPACQNSEPDAPKPASLIDAMDELNTAQHLTELLYLAGEALRGVDPAISNAIIAGVNALKGKLDEVEALLEELQERKREGRA
ncbi:hypothetical protein [Blastochloris viridis]|uniref:Uncharacterized protein n=1 Tax=Blastochloris viridis TaxID=1079 RepID=A0A0H5BEF9_BLAVI|nr:hypothetical protein [Blastochloris viridis]ALK09514.1 hypothetical protein BVIR_1739 [Blastochloris viridis]BAS00601.1 hypothetical protein BV133_3007 [Blastochloris viridis]CUU42177.1 hypothetical protein BVIRIDIS_11840 [Blastochloris viridis]